MASRSTASKAPAAEDPAVSPSDLEPTVGDPAGDLEATPTGSGGSSYVMQFDGVDDGPVTFSRGDESYTFDVKDGRISTTKERATWLARYTAASPVAEKE